MFLSLFVYFEISLRGTGLEPAQALSHKALNPRQETYFYFSFCPFDHSGTPAKSGILVVSLLFKKASLCFRVVLEGQAPHIFQIRYFVICFGLLDPIFSNHLVTCIPPLILSLYSFFLFFCFFSD